MKLLVALAFMSTSLVQAQPAVAIPREMEPLRMLQGEWYADGGWVEFRFNAWNTRMACRVRTEKAEKWRDRMIISSDGSAVNAEFFDVDGKIFHYRLVESGSGRLVFVSSGRPLRRITYVRIAPDRIRYTFEAGTRVTDSGMLVRRARILPLTE
jgi:hypothetical protein